MTICNGTHTDAIEYTEEQKKKFIPIIEKVRKRYGQMCDHINELYTGSRCRSNDDIFATMGSADQSELFKFGDEMAVMDAYANCMSRDYYYEIEKRYT